MLTNCRRLELELEFLWVIRFCWMLPTLASLGPTSLGSGLWVHLLLQLILVR